VQMLMGRINDGRAASLTLLRPELTVRGSTAAARSSTAARGGITHAKERNL
jgi:hypothetical protein